VLLDFTKDCAGTKSGRKAEDYALTGISGLHLRRVDPEVSGFYRLPRQSCDRAYSSRTRLIVFAISLFVRGFIANALMPAALALSASTT